MSGRVTKHIRFLTRAIKDISEVETATTAQIECIVEIIFNIINNEKFFLTDRELKVLKPALPLLTAISKIRSASDARCEILKLRTQQFNTVIKSALDVFGQ